MHAWYSGVSKNSRPFEAQSLRTKSCVCRDTLQLTVPPPPQFEPAVTPMELVMEAVMELSKRWRLAADPDMGSIDGGK